MSVFGGDSWGREAQYRKRRVDDLLLDGIDLRSYKKLSTGKYACLLCPHSPLLDTPLLLSMHIKGSRHQAAESRFKERELARQDEIKKRVALSSDQGNKLAKKPLIEQTKKATSETIQNKTHQQSTTLETQVSDGDFSKDNYVPNDPKEVEQQQLDYRARRERELKFTAAGWKRDCYGGWFRDENVEFDSDEEDPNISLAR